MLASTHDPDTLLERGLAEIVGRLGFERGAMGLVDPEAGVVGAWRVAGSGAHEPVAGAPVAGSAAREPVAGSPLADLAVALGDSAAAPAILARADGPLRFRDAGRTASNVNRRLAEALGSDGLVGTPLASGGRVAGVLVVPDRRHGSDLEPADGPLLYTIGSLFAGALDAARLQATLEAQNRSLEARVTERTRDLAAALVDADQARAAAEAANEAKSQFLSSVSHELRTPLTSVVGFARINRKRLDEVVFPVVPGGDPKVDRAVRQVGENLGIIVSEGERLTGLINDLLDLAKIEAGRFDWQMADTRVEEVVAQALSATASLFDGAAGGPTLETRIADDLPVVQADGRRLVQVVINLVSNAVKFTPATGTIAVRVTPHAAENDRERETAVRVEVQDSGKGIPEADLERIFEPFRQSSDTVPDGPRGTGLGLPISRQIVHAHGGEMGVRSTPGAGSTFWFTVPAAPAIPGELPAEAPATPWDHPGALGR